MKNFLKNDTSSCFVVVFVLGLMEICLHRILMQYCGKDVKLTNSCYLQNNFNSCHWVCRASCVSV